MSVLPIYACVENTGTGRTIIAARLKRLRVKSGWHFFRTKCIGVRKVKTTVKKDFTLETSFLLGCCFWLSWVGCLSVQFQRLRQGLPWPTNTPPAGPKLRPAFPWCSICFATRKSHSFVCHLAPSHSAHPFKRTSFPRPQALLPFSVPTDYVLAGAHGYFMKHRNSEATTEKRLKAFNGYVANLLRDMK
ncbi:uncharacterized protein LOC144152649 isoform X2 [Haemaphysalis longicornis]